MGKVKDFIRDCVDSNIAKQRKRYMKKRIVRLKNKDFSLISNNCNGGVLLHDLGLRFNSPFVNLAIYAEDYVKYLENFDYYNSLEIKFVDNPGLHPVGVLDDVFYPFHPL